MAIYFGLGVVSLGAWHDAIVEGWVLGQACGGVIADILTGVVSPSGRLAETIPLALTDTPSYLFFPGENEHVRYAQGMFVGYRWYTSTQREVRYPFGHGLSYTTFAQELVAVEATGDDLIRVRIAVTNTGAVEGGEVVQAYVEPPLSPARRPVRHLAAFAKVHLAPGESQVVELEVDRSVLAYWDVPGQRWVVQPGSYTVLLGRSANDAYAAADVLLVGDVDRPQPLTLEATVGEWFAHPVVGPMLLGMLAGADGESVDLTQHADNLRLVSSMPMAQLERFLGGERTDEALGALVALSAADWGCVSPEAALGSGARRLRPPRRVQE